MARLIQCLATAALALPGWAYAQSCPSRASWPTADWPAPLTAATTRPAEVAALEANQFTLTGADSERLGIRTDGLIIIKNGQILYERYARGWSATNRHRTWSVSKAVTSALAGLAVHRGALSLDDPLGARVNVVNPDPAVAQISLRQLLEFSSGLDWAEVYERDVYQTSSVLAMLYGIGRRNAVRFVESHPLRAAPGTTFRYSSGDSTLLAAMVSGAMATVYGNDFPHTELFDPIGMSDVAFERDPSNNLMGGTSVYATPRDMARFGFLYLNDGCWDGVRYLPVGWVDSTRSVASVLRTGTMAVPEENPAGWQFWLNLPVPEQSMPLPWPDVPTDAYLAWGHWGQFIIIVPSQDVLIIRTGDDRNESVDMNEFIKLALQVAQ